MWGTDLPFPALYILQPESDLLVRVYQELFLPNYNRTTVPMDVCVDPFCILYVPMGKLPYLTSISSFVHSSALSERSFGYLVISILEIRSIILFQIGCYASPCLSILVPVVMQSVPNPCSAPERLNKKNPNVNAPSVACMLFRNRIRLYACHVACHSYLMLLSYSIAPTTSHPSVLSTPSLQAA